jgi:hypothetical protein
MRDKMVATYRIKANEIDDFLRLFRTDYADRDLTVTVETAYMSPFQDITNARILSTVEAENSGGKPFKIMTIEEMEALARC